MLNVPFCPIVQKLRRNECEVSIVKIPQHKVTKYLLLYSFENFTTGNPTQTPFFFFVKNPVYVNLLVGIVNYYLLFPSGARACLGRF